jgi:Choline/Carnitine o-acyltransferase
MTKMFLHGRTEAIRTVQLESVHFVKVNFRPAHDEEIPPPLTCHSVLDFLFRSLVRRKNKRPAERV